jgi:outer membrane receptor protein involved in Fe transport
MMAKYELGVESALRSLRPVQAAFSLRTRVLLTPFPATTLFALLAGAPMLLMPAAHAQAVPAAATEAPQDGAAAEDVAGEDAAQSQPGIVVTGTRISGFTAPTPVTMLGAEELETKAVTTVAELLDDVPQLRINQNIGKSSEPVGGSNADLRGLGTQRTLVLLDGRRLAPTDPAGTIDTNIVPTALISSIEIVTGGASAAYGSDAVAGVVNFVLDKKFTGFKLDASYGQTTYDDHHRPSVSAAWGTSLIEDRLHVTVAGDYLHNSGQTEQGSRPWGNDETALLTNPAYTPTNGLPRLIIADNSRFTQMTAGGVLTRATGLALGQRLGFASGTGVQFDRNGNPVPFAYGTNVGGTFMTGGDGATVEDEGNIMPEIQRYTGYGSVRFDVTPDISVFADALYSQVDTLSDLTPNPDNGGITIRNDNAFLAAPLRTAMGAAGLTSISMGRMNYEDGFSIFDSSTKTRRVTFGVEGRSGNWTWDVSGQIGRNSYQQRSDNNRINARWTLGLDSVINPATGQAICRALLNNPNPTAAQDPYRDIRDCQPINPFGAGAISDRALDYYRGSSYLHSKQEQDVFAANLSGAPFSTWAGDVKVAVGAEYRREQTIQTSDVDSELRRWRSVNAQPFTGEYNVKEAYAEVVVPLARGSRFAENLDLNGAVRYTDYSTSGGVVTWKAGVNYAPFEDLRFRGTVSRDIRAPNNYELFSRGNQVINAIIDPRTNVSRQTVQITSGNPLLKPEKADTLTAGVIFQPSWLPGFRASVDYYSIKIKQAISTIAPQGIVDFCEAGRTEFCTGVIRDPVTNILTQVNVIPFNADSLKTSGVDVELLYRLPLLGGDVRLRGLGNYVAELSTTSNGVTNDYVGLAGISPPPAGVPEWRINLDADYAIDNFKLGIGYRYIDGGKFDTRFNTTTLDLADNNVSGRSYVDVSTSYRMTKQVEIYGRVENLFNVNPPITPNGITQPTVANGTFFDRRGTFFVVGGRLRL